MTSLLEHYRKDDEKSSQGETLPEQQTLNSERIAGYLKENGYTTVENFDQRFGVSAALEILNIGGTKGETEMVQIIQDGQSYLTSIGRDKEMEKAPTSQAFFSTIRKDLEFRKQLDKEANLRKSYETYSTVRDLCRKRLVIQERFTEQRENEIVEMGKGIKDTFGDALKTIKKNYKGMSGKEKLLAVGALLIGTVMLVKSKNEYVTAAKDYLWTGAKVAGVGVGVNYLWKLFAGKTALDWISDETGSGVGSSTFLKETFSTDSEKAEVLGKSTIYLGDKDFLDLASRYRKARASGEKKIELASVSKKDMTPEEIYIALDVFFSKYPVEKLQLRYKKAKAKPNWTSVVTTMLAEDGKIQFSGNLYERTVAGIDSGVTRGWNWMITGEGLGVTRWMYLKWHGTEGSDQEVKTWFEKHLKDKLQNAVGAESEIPAFCDRKFSQNYGPHFKDVYNSGVVEAAHPNIKYKVVPGEAVYLMSSVNMNPTRGGERMTSRMLQNSLDQADKFLKEKYPDVAANINKFRDVEGGCRVTNNSTFKLFVKMPIPGSPLYSRRSVLAEPEKKRPGASEIFKPTDKIEYARLKTYEQERLRLLFMMDGTRGADLEKICKWFTDEYKHRSETKVEVYKRMLTNPKERDKCLRELGISSNLAGRYNILQTKENEINEIEREAAQRVDTTILRTIGEYASLGLYEPSGDPYDGLVLEMKQSLGFKLRLAIMGDPQARNEINFIANQEAAKGTSFLSKVNPANWFDDDEDVLMKLYKKKCIEYVDKVIAGNA